MKNNEEKTIEVYLVTHNKALHNLQSCFAVLDYPRTSRGVSRNLSDPIK